ncbi:methyl-accepting chemotaxis protein, partial [Escherichia coli]|nr:methyl-accepting chemotaxis protein [Escherichia coli]
MNTTPSHRLGFLHHIRLVPLFACILGGILVLFALSSALAGYFLWQADRDQRVFTGGFGLRPGFAASSAFLLYARIHCLRPGAEVFLGRGEKKKKKWA